MWVYNTKNAGTTSQEKSRIILDVAEEFRADRISPAESSFICVGGANGYATYGLGNWHVGANLVDKNGVYSAVTRDMYQGANLESEHRVGLLAAASALNQGSDAGTNGCYTATQYVSTGATIIASPYVVGGFTASTQDCLTYAIDGYVITGIPVVYRFLISTFIYAVTANTCGYAANLCFEGSADMVAIDSQTAGYNAGSLTVVKNDYTTGNTYVLITSYERYGDSYIGFFAVGDFKTA